MAEWTRVKLGDVAREITVGHVGPMQHAYQSHGIPFLRSQNVLPHRIDLSDVKFIGPEFHDSLAKSTLRPGDVITVRTGAPGTTAVVPESLGTANCADLVITRTGPQVDPHWLSYSMNNAVDRLRVMHLVGAVQQHFNVGAARHLELDLPPLVEQRAIAEVLGALDDKIAANREVTRLALELGESIARREATGPTTPLDEFADIAMGSSPPGMSYNEDGEGHVFFQGVRDFGTVSPSPRVWTTQPVRLAAPMATLIAVRAPVGDINLADREICIGRGLAAASSSEFPMTLYFLLRTAQAAWAPYQGTGTVFASINAKQLRAIEIATVARESAAQVEQRLGTLMKRALTAETENETLAKTRDGLLPLLMSGKLRVKDAEREVGEVV